jgi:Glu-tRNA(Gln) amidotransferase subunit E-like FAD-binding protein
MKISSELGMFVDEIIPQPISDDELEKEILLAEEQMSKMKFIKDKNAVSIIMGILMNKLRGRISAKKVAQKINLLQKDLKNVK